ncbi:hypothetical protein M153_2570002111, partial [Pseudoloma neurophilia]
LPGSIVHSDQWAAYNNLQSLEYVHSTVNPRSNFVGPNSRAHTQHIESLWNRWKQIIKQMKGIRGEKLQEYLFEIISKENNNSDLFIVILDLISDFEYR